jgi:hypothetical protein
MQRVCIVDVCVGKIAYKNVLASLEVGCPLLQCLLS